MTNNRSRGMEEIDHEWTDEIVCPWCGHEYTDSWEMDDYETRDCDECGKPFTLSRYVSVTYDTEKVEEDV